MRDDIRNEIKDLVAGEMEKYSISKNELDAATDELRKLFTKTREEQRQHRAWIGDLGRSFQHIKDNENYLYYVKELEKKLAKLEHEVQNDDRIEKVKQEVLAQVENKDKNFVSLRNDFNREVRSIYTEIDSAKKLSGKYKKELLYTLADREEALRNEIKNVAFEAKKANQKQIPDVPDYKSQIKTLFNELQSIKDKVKKLDKETKPKEMKDMFRHVENEVDNLRAEIENIGKKSNNLEKKLSRPEGEE
jgi:hypothetical protein